MSFIWRFKPIYLLSFQLNFFMNVSNRTLNFSRITLKRSLFFHNCIRVLINQKIQKMKTFWFILTSEVIFFALQAQEIPSRSRLTNIQQYGKFKFKKVSTVPWIEFLIVRGTIEVKLTLTYLAVQSPNSL